MHTEHPHHEHATLPGSYCLVDRATSSLDVAHELTRQGRLEEWGSVLVREQSAGRGQLRRAWTSPRGNLHAALRLPRLGPFAALAAAPALGLMLANALCSLGFSVKSKWPNDIVQESLELSEQKSWRKVGGILLEDRGEALIAGIGLNAVAFPETESMRDGHAFPAGRLSPDRRLAPERQAGAEALLTDIERFWTCLASALFSCYTAIDGGTSESRWLNLVPHSLAFVGLPVWLEDIQSATRVRGIVEGVHGDGSLRLRTARSGEGAEHFMSGSLSLR